MANRTKRDESSEGNDPGIKRRVILSIVILLYLFILWILFPNIFIDDGNIWLALLAAIILTIILYNWHIFNIELETILAIGVIVLTALFFLLQNIQSVENSIDAINSANQYNCLTAQEYVMALSPILHNGLYIDPFVTAVYENNLGVLTEKLGSQTFWLMHALAAMYDANGVITLNEGVNVLDNQSSSIYILQGNEGLLAYSQRLITYLTIINKDLGGPKDFCSTSSPAFSISTTTLSNATQNASQ